MSFDESRFLQAIKEGDIAYLRATLTAHPEYLDINMSLPSNYTGFALYAAALFDQPKVVRFLVQEFGVDINRQKGHRGRRTPLHHASCFNALHAAEVLLLLGADPTLLDNDNMRAIDRCVSHDIRLLLNPALKEKIRAGTWSLSTPVEVIHARELPEQKLRLTEIFNFEKRRVTSITKDLKDGQMAQTILLFDDITDTQFVHDAHAKLTELGGKVDPHVIDYRPLRGKTPFPGK